MLSKLDRNFMCLLCSYSYLYFESSCYFICKLTKEVSPRTIILINSDTEAISYLTAMFFCFLAILQGQGSPTTGTLFMFGSTNDNDPIRFGGGPPSVGDGPNAFPFKPLDLKSSHYTAEAMKVSNM